MATTSGCRSDLASALATFSDGRFHFLSATLSEPKGHQLEPPSFELS
jgi:hypothetical protein